MKNRTHAPHPDEEKRAIRMSLCRVPASKLSESLAEVDCKDCRRAAARRAKSEAEETARLVIERRRVAAEEKRRADLEDVVSAGLPVLTRETYAALECTCGACAVCRFYADARQQAQFPPRHIRDVGMRDFSWGSVTEAIAAYAIIRLDGFDAGKSIQQAATEHGELGGRIQQSSRDPIRKAYFQATEVSLIDTILESAYAGFEGGWRRAAEILAVRTVGLVAREKCTKVEANGNEGMVGKLRMVLVRLDDEALATRFGISVAEVRSIAGRGRRALTVELGARGMVPPPSSKSRAWAAYEDRLREVVDAEDAAERKGAA